MKKITFAYNWRKLPKKIFTVWLKRYKLLFSLSFVIVASWGGYEWRHNLFVYHWSSEDRQRYLEATIKETAFQEKDFLEVLGKIEKGTQKHAETVTAERDLFIGAREEETAPR